MSSQLQLTNEWDKVFPQSDEVRHEKVTFRNHFGITLAADVYKPKGAEGKLPAIAVSGPYGAVKEQSSGLYAQEMAKRGFLTLAFDPSFTGESGGEPRAITSPDFNVEDFQAAVDYLSNRDDVDANKIAIIGVCGWGGMALQAACIDTRIKATVASTMYDMTRVAGNGYFDTDDNSEARHKARVALSEQRTKDFKSGSLERAGGVIDPLPTDVPQFVKDYHAYYKTPRGYHERSLNSTDGWAIQSSTSLLNTRLLRYGNEIEAPVLIVHGEKAHSRYFGEGAFEMITGEKFEPARAPEPYTGAAPIGSTKRGNKELLIVEGVSHVDLYDDINKIPFDNIETFLRESLAL